MKPATYLVIPDTHVTYDGAPDGGIDPKANSCLFQAIDIVKPDGIVHIGDLGEWSAVSHWQWKHRKRPPHEYIQPLIDKEINGVNTWLDKLEKAASKNKCSSIHIIQGNHEKWLDFFAAEEARPEIAAKVCMKIKDRGFGWSDHGTFHKIGKLNLTHGGHFTGLHHAYKTVIGLSASCMYGHFHNVEYAHVMHLGGAFGAWAIGCLCTLQKTFLNHRPTSWSHAISLVHVERDGNFHVELIDIFEGVCYVYGKKVVAK